MIAIDTNVLLRYLLRDDDEQLVKASKLLSGIDRVLVTDVVLVETLWTLKGNKYKLKKDELVDVILALFKEPMVRFENGQVVWKALNAYREANPIKGKEPDFADALIVCKAQHVSLAEGEEFGGSYTFDVAAQALDGAKRP